MPNKTELLKDFAKDLTKEMEAIRPALKVKDSNIIKPEEGNKLGLVLVEPSTKNISPIYYITDDVIDHYKEGKIDLHEYAISLTKWYDKYKIVPKQDVNITADYIYSHVYPVLVNSMNEEVLGAGEIYYRPFSNTSDLLIYYRVDATDLVNIPDGVTSSFAIKWNMIDSLDLDLMDLYIRANKNAFEKARLCTMQEMLRGSLPDEILDMMTEPMFILNYKDCAHGGAGALSSGDVKDWVFDVLYPFSENEDHQGERVLLIPSSKNEWIMIPIDIFPDHIFGDALLFADMIKDVNRTNVADEDVLSDHPYIMQMVKKDVGSRVAYLEAVVEDYVTD